MTSPAILINAFNRPGSLKRLLHSLLFASIPDNTPLVISIDAGGDPYVPDIASSTQWPFGEKTVLLQPKPLGLIGHFLYCGGLTGQFGDIIYLEDDLIVSRQFCAFAHQALSAYRSDERIAGISLNRLHFNGYTQLPFEPRLDSSDTFFAQVYLPHGQAYTPEMWSAFERWWHTDRRPITRADGLHPLFLPHSRWKADFFPSAMHYLASSGRFFVFPRESMSVNSGDAGVHFNHSTRFFQTPLQHERNLFRFCSMDDAGAVYDSYQEIQPDRLSDALPGYTFDVDLNGTKPPEALKRPWTLTTRPVRRAEMTFGLTMRPPEANVLENVPGTGISLARKEDVRYNRLADLQTENRRFQYAGHGRISLRKAVLFRLLRLLETH